MQVYFEIPIFLTKDWQIGRDAAYKPFKTSGSGMQTFLLSSLFDIMIDAEYARAPGRNELKQEAINYCQFAAILDGKQRMYRVYCKVGISHLSAAN